MVPSVTNSPHVLWRCGGVPPGAEGVIAANIARAREVSGGSLSLLGRAKLLLVLVGISAALLAAFVIVGRLIVMIAVRCGLYVRTADFVRYDQRFDDTTKTWMITPSNVRIPEPKVDLSCKDAADEICKWASLHGKVCALNVAALTTKISWAHSVLLQGNPGQFKWKNSRGTNISIISSKDYAFVSTKVVVAKPEDNVPISKTVKIALKVDKAGKVSLSAQLKSTLRLEIEAKNLSALQSIDRVVRFYHYDRTYSVQKKISRERIYEEFCSGGPPLPSCQPLSISLMEECLKMAAAFAEKGYSLFDLKIENVVLDSCNKLRVIDLEAVQLIGEGQTYGLRFSPRYCSPEALEAFYNSSSFARQILVKHDSFSLGAMFYLWMFGKPKPDDDWVVVADHPAFRVDSEKLEAIITALNRSSDSRCKLTAALLSYDPIARLSSQQALDVLNSKSVIPKRMKFLRQDLMPIPSGYQLRRIPVEIVFPQKELNCTAAFQEIRAWTQSHSIHDPFLEGFPTAKILWAYSILQEGRKGQFKWLSSGGKNISIISSNDYAFVSTKVVVAKPKQGNGAPASKTVKIALKVDKAGKVSLAAQLKSTKSLEIETKNLRALQSIDQVVRFYHYDRTYSLKKKISRERIYEEFCSGGPPLPRDQLSCISLMKECLKIAAAFAKEHYSLSDLKIENVVVDSHNKLRVIDLEAVQLINNGKTDGFCYSPRYCSPEALEAYNNNSSFARQILVKHDSFSLGAMFYLWMFRKPEPDKDWVVGQECGGLRWFRVDRQRLEAIITALNGSSDPRYKLTAALLAYDAEKRPSPQRALDWLNKQVPR